MCDRVSVLMEYLHSITQIETDENLEKMCDAALNLHTVSCTELAKRRSRPSAKILLLRPSVFEERD